MIFTLMLNTDRQPTEEVTQERKSVADILKLVLNLNVELPKLVAVDISRLLP